MTADPPALVVVSLPSLLFPCTSGESEVSVEASPPTLNGAIDSLIASYPLLGPHLMDPDGGLRRHVNLFLGDRDVRWLEDWETPVREGDRLTVLQNVSGG